MFDHLATWAVRDVRVPGPPFVTTEDRARAIVQADPANYVAVPIAEEAHL